MLLSPSVHFSVVFFSHVGLLIKDWEEQLLFAWGSFHTHILCSVLSQKPVTTESQLLPQTFVYSSHFLHKLDNRCNMTVAYNSTDYFYPPK